MKIARGSASWIILPSSIGIFLFLLFYLTENIFSGVLLFTSLISFLLAGTLLLFFRDPQRIIAKGVVSPADGMIRAVETIDDNDVGVCKHISIFMNLYDVHVNRMPISGKIVDLTYISGSHLPAFKKDAAENERLIILSKTKIGMVKIIQIAGTIARRIVPYISTGDIVKKGDKIGIIRLGSRVDIYLPIDKKYHLKIQKGNRVKAGESSIAEIND
jgi:phosphatidylserine decarboxylase